MDIKVQKKESQSRTGMSGSPKKGGAGGKGTWGVGGIGDLVQAKVQRGDPNYNSDDEDMPSDKHVIRQTIEIENPLHALLRQYYVEGDASEAVKEIGNLKLAPSEIIRKTVVSGMEHQPYERELVSKLLSALYGSVLASVNFEEGFQDTLSKLDDLSLDIPHSAEMLGKFIARAIVDEIVPPSFLKHAKIENRLAAEAIALASGLVNDNHRSKKLEHIWGPGDLQSVKQLKREASTLVAEFLTTGDKEEADRCVRKLSAQTFHFQLVRQALRMALSAREGEQKKIEELLAYFSKSGLISSDHMEQGFKALSTHLDDIKLDIPAAPTAFAQIVKNAQSSGWLSVDFK